VEAVGVGERGVGVLLFVRVREVEMGGGGGGGGGGGRLGLIGGFEACKVEGRRRWMEGREGGKLEVVMETGG